MSVMSRKKIKNKREFRIFVHKTGQHFYAQLIDKYGNIRYSYSTLALKSSMKKESQHVNLNFVNSNFVKQISEHFAKSIKEIGATESSYYDRGRKKYCGLVKLFAETLRENGILI